MAPMAIEPLERMDDTTLDTFFNGRIQVRQHRNGYRFSIDAVLLASQTVPTAGGRVVDLGTGCGIIPLILAHRHTDIQLWGVEVQPESARLAALNVRANHLYDRIDVLNRDMRDLNAVDLGGRVDWVITNPPYRRVAAGRINLDARRAIARHELKITLAEVIMCAGRLLAVAGKFAVVYPSERLVELFVRMRAAAIEPKVLRPVHSRRHEGAKVVLVEGAKGGRPGLKIAAPLIVYADGGGYSDQVTRMFESQYCPQDH